MPAVADLEKTFTLVLEAEPLYQKMREIDPNLVTVLMSGWQLEDGDSRLALFSGFGY